MGNRSFCAEAGMRCAADCARITINPGQDQDSLDEYLACDPAGAVFEETLEELNDVNKQLLLFCSGANLAAVRWLFVIGAHREACDSNGTTCLHAACRSGTLPIIKDLVARGAAPLDATDISGWTPLHIAVFMGRRDAVLYLLKSGASMQRKNLKGQTPMDLATDTWTMNALSSYMAHLQSKKPEEVWQYFQKEDGQAKEQFSSSATGGPRYEPFFVPRSPIIREQVYKKEFQKIGLEIFNRKPGQGLAFLVAVGSTRDYPVDMSAFLRRNRVDTAQIGNFLGEAFSLSQILRLEFMNSVKFIGTGVVSSLSKVFLSLQIPPDLQKIDRILHGVARIWWRQHEKLGRVAEASSRPLSGDGDGEGEAAELEGVELKQYFASADGLYQLMFSVLMLHWNLYAPIPASQRMTLGEWLQVNKGLEGDGADVPIHIQKLIYNLVSRAFIPQLQIRKAEPPAGGENGTPRQPSPLAPHASVDGWVRLLGGGFPSPAGLGGTVTYGHIANVLSGPPPT